jgi:hypothetical protein
MARRPYFSGNYGSALGSTANAANLIARAGEVQGQMYANLGQQVGGAIEKYQLNKEKREAEERTAMGNLLAFSPEDIGQINQENPEFGKSIEKVMNGTHTRKDIQSINAGVAPFIARKTREREARYKDALTTSKINENNLFETTKSLTLENKELTNKSKRLENVLKGVEAYIKVESLPEELQSTLRKLNEDIAEADAKEASRKAYTPTERALNEKAQAGATIAKTEQDIEGNKNKNKITPLRDTEGNVVPGSYMINGTPFTKDPTGTLARVGTPSENVVETRTNKAEELINQGRQIAKDYDVTSEPLDANIIGGADLGGIYEDALLYVGGKVGLSGEQIDSVLGKGMLGGTQAREEQTARIDFLNNKIKPALVRAVTARGNVYTQKQIDEDILIQTNESNSKVNKKLREYPRLLDDALLKAESVIRDPEIKPGTQIYEDARQVVLQVPKILKQLNASIGETDQYDMDPSMKRIMEGSIKRTTPVVDSNFSNMSDAELLKSLIP